MRRMVVEKKMDFVSFRRYLGAGSMRLDEMTPQPGVIYDPGQTLTVSAKIPNHETIDPKSVGMALLSVPGSLPFSYDPRTGAISVAAVKDALKGTYQRALVWATDAKSGKRIEASWIFKLPAPVLPVAPSLVTDPQRVDACRGRAAGAVGRGHRSSAAAAAVRECPRARNCSEHRSSRSAAWSAVSRLPTAPHDTRTASDHDQPTADD